MINIEGVFRKHHTDIAVRYLVFRSSRIRGDLTEYRGKGSIDSEGYQDGKTLGKRKRVIPNFS